MVFTYNGNVNDYFIGLFFFHSANLGRVFFMSSGLVIQDKPYFFDEKEN